MGRGRPANDLTGVVFGRLTAMTPVIGKYAWECSCECGKTCVVASGNLRSGSTKSCGCLLRDTARNLRAAMGRASRKHGQAGGRSGTRTPEYSAWLAMKDRCYRQGHKNYPLYGGRGIIVCARWIESFEAFFADIGPRPSSKHSIDRIDTNGNYEPDNCRWATAFVQNNNRRNVKGSRYGQTFGL